MQELEPIREYENLHILLWLLKDICWLMEFKLAGLFMAIPTIIVALHITWLKRKQLSELLHNMAICHWISANAIWMIGEFFYNDTLRPISAIFFALGFITLFIYYGYLLPKRFLMNKKTSD